MPRKKLIILVSFCLFIIIAAITNPKESQHKSKIKSFIINESGIQKEMLSPGEKNPFSMIGYSIGMSMLNNMVDNLVIVDNYVIFSITKLQYPENTITAGIGFLGNVTLIISFNKPENQQIKQLNIINNINPFENSIKYTRPLLMQPKKDRIYCFDYPGSPHPFTSVIDSIIIVSEKNGQWYRIANFQSAWVHVDDLAPIK